MVGSGEEKGRRQKKMKTMMCVQPENLNLDGERAAGVVRSRVKEQLGFDGDQLSYPIHQHQQDQYQRSPGIALGSLYDVLTTNASPCCC